MADERFVEVEGGRLYLESAGEGPAVVLIHPGLWDSRTWDGQFEAFAERHRVVRYDVRGHGRSSRPEPGRSYSHIRDLAAVLDGVSIDRAALVGCSMGGAIALGAALEIPARVRGLVLVAPGLPGLEGTPEEEAWWEEWDARVVATAEAGDVETAVRMEMDVWAPLGLDDEAGRRIFEIAMANAHELTMDESGAEAFPLVIDVLEQILVPTLVIPADHDPADMQRACAELVERLPNARTAVIRNVDHVVNMREPAEFNRIVLDFLSQVV